MEFWIKAAQLILSLSILIVLHELGHFIPAKLFKTRVEKFYLFFNPWFSLFKVKRGETEYGLGWLPLGGYVKISGMIDESMDKDQLAKAPEPWEFRSKPAWQRLIIMIGGVTVNLILGFLIYSMVLWAWGDTNLPVKEVKYGIACDKVFLKAGLQDGDKILSVNGEVPEDFMDINRLILLRDARKIKVERNGEIKTINLPEDIDYQMIRGGARSGISPRIPSVIDTVVANGNGEKAGFKKGDTLVSINGKQCSWFHEFTAVVDKNKGKSVTIELKRNGELKTISVVVDKNKKIGLGPLSMSQIFKLEDVEYGFFDAIPAGFGMAIQKLSDYVISLKFLFTKEGASQMGGFGTIGSLFSSTWDWHSFWMLTAFLSIILAFMNILPIPALDGGHVMFLLWEVITGRPVKQKVLEYAQMVGMILLLGLLLYANGNDIVKLFQ